MNKHVVINYSEIDFAKQAVSQSSWPKTAYLSVHFFAEVCPIDFI